jgi:hypothetical protein
MTATARAEIHSEGLEDLVLRPLFGVTLSTTFAATEEVVLEPREAIPNARAEDFTRDVSIPKQLAAT